MGTELIEVRMPAFAAEESTAPTGTAPARASDALDRRLPPGGALHGRIFNRLVADPPGETPLPPGTEIGCWRLGRLLGCGGSSMVYLADRAGGHFEQQAAIKIVRPDPRLIEQFRRERQILATLCHPSIARLIDGGTYSDGRPWFAMEAILGQRIDHYVEGRGLRLRDRLALFEQVCEVVAYAHARALVHRDIKPGNLIVDETGRPRLLDFGIAMDDGAGDDGVYRAMTPIYASPEQRAGGVVTKSSDIYQLGMLLGTIMMPVRGLPPQLPQSGIAEALCTIVERATAPEPAHRFASVAALRAEIVAIRRRATLRTATTIIHARRGLDRSNRIAFVAAG
jgi:serine/threonine-protein kinase